MERYRIQPEAAVYYLANTIVGWLPVFVPVFVSEASCKIVTDCLTFWQPSRHPEAVQGEHFWQQKLDNLHDNPRRKGLVHRPDHWRFSSAAWYLSDGAQAVDVPLTAITW
jgi:hypothetical protein